MKKKNPGADNNQPQEKKKIPQKDGSALENLPSREDTLLNREKENKKQNPPTPQNKGHQQQSECNDLNAVSRQILGRIPGENQGNDENVIPEQGLGRIPDEEREEVEEKSKNI